MEAELLAMLDTTVTIAQAASRDAYGKPTMAAGVIYQARVQPKVQLVINEQGQEVPIMGVVYLPPTAAVRTTSTITFADGTTMPVKYVSVVHDNTGPHHVVIGYGR